MQVAVSMVGILHHDCHRGPDLMVQTHGRPRRRTRSGRRMPTSPEARHEDVGRIGAAVAVCALVLCSASARAQSAETCAVPGYLLFGDSLLEAGDCGRQQGQDAAGLSSLGGSSSTLAGPGWRAASPIRRGSKPL